MPCDALARVNATVAKQTLIAELFEQPEVAREALLRLLSQLEGVLTVEGSFAGDTFTLVLSRRAGAVRFSLNRATGQVSMGGGDQQLLTRVRALLEETGGALFQARVIRTLTQVCGSPVEEVPTGSTARRITIRL